MEEHDEVAFIVETFYKINFLITMTGCNVEDVELKVPRRFRQYLEFKLQKNLHEFNVPVYFHGTRSDNIAGIKISEVTK